MYTHTSILMMVNLYSDYHLYCRALTTEYDDLNSKSREADKDVNAMQLKIQEVNNNLAKYHKDKDCKHRYPL